MNTQMQFQKLNTTSTLGYIAGFGNEVESEALPGALPPQNSPQIPPLGLASELVTGSTFAAPRHLNRRSYMFRIRPSTEGARYERIDNRDFLSPPFNLPIDPNQIGWSHFPAPTEPADFIDGMHTLCGNGSPVSQTGMAVHMYLANKSMTDRVLVNADGEFMIVPQKGALRVFTETGILEIDKDEICIIPKGIKFRVDLIGEFARGFLIENYGQYFQLPYLGLIGGHGLANQIDFLAPVAAYEDREVPTQLVKKFGGNLWAANLKHSPLDVVAWRGNLTAYKYDMKRFVPIGNVVVDHPDPSVYCALTSPGDPVLGANAEFLILNPRQNVANTLRPPGFHQNCVAEFVGHLEMPEGPEFAAITLANNWSPHGPGTAIYEKARLDDLNEAEKIGGMSFLIETRLPMQLTDFGYNTDSRKKNYQDRWAGFKRRHQP